MVLLMMVMSLVATGCGVKKNAGADFVQTATEQEMEETTIIENEEPTEVDTEETLEVVEENSEESLVNEMEETQENGVFENSQQVVDSSSSKLENTKENTKVQNKEEVKIQTPTKQEPVVEEPTLKNADHPFFEVFFVEHCYKYDGEYYYWGFYMPYGCDTDNCPEYNEAYYELVSKMKGERSYVFYGLDGEFADLGEYSFVRIGYKVPTEYMPETLTILYDDNVHWGKAGYIVYYTEEEWDTERWNEVYWEFHDNYVSYDEEGRMNLYHDTRYFVDGELKCFYVWID